MSGKYGSIERAARVSFSKDESHVAVDAVAPGAAAAAAQTVGQYFRDQLPKQPRRQADSLGRPLLSGSQSSLKDAQAAAAATAATAATTAKEASASASASTQNGCYSRELAASSDELRPQRQLGRRPSGSAASSGSGRSRASSCHGSCISFSDIRYVVPVRRYPWSRAQMRTVLQDVTGVMRPGLNAIMGPTGSGKSSLLDALAGRKDPRYLDGEILLDGRPLPHNFKCVSGYVVQDDIVMGTLTVRENLYFSAAVRLPANITDSQRRQKVEEVIEELNLDKVSDSKIGTELIRGVSGGERKRTNIGMELITDPSVLFLDEPTTGLDAFTAGSVIKTLRKLAASGRTIVFSIHQPRYSIYRLFNYLTLVVAGRVVYQGRAGDAPLAYFRDIGYVCSLHNSPPDFFMDIVHGEAGVAASDAASEFSDPVYFANPGNSSQAEAADTVIDVDAEEQRSQSQAIGQQLIDRWHRSELARAIRDEVAAIRRDSDAFAAEPLPMPLRAAAGKAATGRYPTAFSNQLYHVSWRTWLNLFRNPQSSVIQVVVYLFFGVSIGTVFFGLDTSLESGIQNRQGLFFFLTLQMVFVNLSAVEVFIKEQAIFIHEHSSGFYSVAAYFLAKIFCDMLPIKALPVLLFMPIVYFMSQLKLQLGAFLFYELNLVLATCAACGVAFFVSASVSVFGIANIFISIIYVFMMVFGGFIINIASVGGWLAWCKYFSVFYYAFAGLSVNEFTGLRFCPRTATANESRPCKDGALVLVDQQIPYSTGWDLWCNEVGMLCIATVFLVLCYVQLCRTRLYK